MSDTPENIEQEVTPVDHGGEAVTPGEHGVVHIDDERQIVSRRGRRLLIAIVIVLLLALVGVTVVLAGLARPRGGVASGDDAGGLVWVRSIYGWGEDPADQFQVPRKATVGPNGTIWVTDSTKQVAFSFGPDGDFLRAVGDQTDTPINGAGAIAVGPDASVLIGESDMDRVRAFDVGGADLGSFAIPSPLDIEYDEENETLVISSVAGYAIIDPDTGTPVSVIGSRGMGPEQFDTVAGVGVAPDGTVYAVDTYNNRLVALSPEGQRIWTVQTGHPGNDVAVTGGEAMAASRDTSAPAELELPADVCVDRNGRVVVIDSFDFTIAVFDPADGSLIGKYGSYGSLDGQFRYPSSIAYDPQRDWFVVADTGNARVQIVRIPGSAPFDLGAAARRGLSGPLRACCAPLALILLLVALWVVQRVRRRARDKVARQDAAAGAPQPEDTAENIVEA
jgi:sugar lactone lactonase YvrE